MKHHESNLPLRILVIDDNNAIHQDFCKILRKSPSSVDDMDEMESALFGSTTESRKFSAFEIDSASQGKEGLALIRKAQLEGRPYALAFVDGRMPPGWDGIETISHIWEECPELQVVLCTAYSDYSWKEIHRVLGETDNLLILKKPFDPVEVLQLAHTLTRKWELNRKVQSRIDDLGGMVRESERKYRSMMEAMNDSVYICSPDFRIEYMNPKMISRVSGYSKGEYCYKAVYGLDEPCAWCKLDKVLQGEHIDHEIVNPKDNRSYFVSSSPIYHSDGTISKLSICRDITENKSMEVQLFQARKMESIGTMAGGIAHDFNNMLYIISGNAELAMEGIPEWHPVHDNLKEIKSTTIRAAAVIKQLLNFSRQTHPEQKPIRAITIIEDSLNFLRSTIPASIEIQRKLPKKEVAINGDSAQINQMMVNLCINASQAMEKTGGILTVSVEKIIPDDHEINKHPGMKPGKWLKIVVSDTGPGISPAVIERIFDPYFTTKEVGKGSGMGLSTVHGIVKNHNGTVFVDSPPGSGTTFTVLIPVVASQPLVKTAMADKILRGDGEKILFVDDEASIGNMIGEMLKRIGYLVETRTEPIDALDLFQSKSDAFDLVLTDMTMPQMTGVKLSEKIKELRPDIPVIICTGHSDLVNENTAKKLNIDGYVMKPIVMRDIAKKIRDVLNATKDVTHA